VPPLALATLVLGACASGSDDPEPAEEAVATPTQGVYGTAPEPAGGIPSVVTLTPMDAGPGAEERAGRRPVIDQFGLAFSPARLITHTGDTIRFTNSESALTHNVQVRSVDGNATLLDEDAVTGQSIELAITDEGGYEVLCDMHPGMSAFVFVTSAPYATFAEADGSFLLDGVPPGDYRASIWSRNQARRITQQVTVGVGATEVRLTPTG
jgi:plastocyanin